MKVMQNFKKQAGVTLLEVMLSLAIIGAIAITAVSFFGNANENNRVIDSIRNVGALSSGIRNMYQANYTGLTNTIVIKSNFLPPNMRVQGSTSVIKHAWSTNGVTIAPATTNFANDSFTVTFTGIPEGSCVQLGGQTWPQYQQVRINGNVVANVSDVSTRCAGASNSIEWLSL